MRNSTPHTPATLEGAHPLGPLDPTKSRRAMDATAAFHRELPNASDVGTGEPEVLELFHRVRSSVPAYAHFLATHEIDGETIHTIADFRTLPPTSKRNYHVAYSLPELCRNGRLEDCDMLAVSSGSTGEPTVWPRFIADEADTVRRFEQVLVQGFDAGAKRTLAVVCFALGSWVGGMFTTSACRQLAAKGYPITVVTPGNNFAEILRVVPKLAPLFEQVVLLGYPPFVKDVLDRGAAAGVQWAEYSVKVVVAGEVFSEAWRDLVASRLGCAQPEAAVASLYGTADAGVLANETPASVLVRRALSSAPTLAQALFGQARLPTLCQYDPRRRYFEEVDGELLFSADGGIPLLRYAILDRGGIVGHSAMLQFLQQHQLLDSALEQELRRYPLPFVFVFGRNNFAVSFYGANVYPENVAPGLETADLAPAVTGKFVLEVVEDAEHDSILQVSVELAVDRQGDDELRDRLASSLAQQLVRANSEFAHYVPKEKQRVVVRCLPTADPTYFPAGVKHRYTR